LLFAITFSHVLSEVYTYKDKLYESGVPLVTLSASYLVTEAFITLGLYPEDSVSLGSIIIDAGVVFNLYDAATYDSTIVRVIFLVNTVPLSKVILIVITLLFN
jgi:hypothetical protein